MPYRNGRVRDGGSPPPTACITDDLKAMSADPSLRPAAAAPAVSVVLPALHPWPAVAAALEALLHQETDRVFEILLVDACGGAALPEPPDPPDPRVRWLEVPGGDTFALRAAGVAAARGRIVAITEDHCIVPPGWVGSIVAAHEAAHELALVGATTNHPDSAASAIDRANFLLTFAGQTGNRLSVNQQRLPVPTNISFKREAIGSSVLPCILEYEWLTQMRDRCALGVANTVVLQHRQCWGAATPLVHWASGQSYGATIRGWRWNDKVRWWLRVPVLPFKMGAFVLPDLLKGAGGAPATLADVFSLGLLIASNVCGQVYGAIRGAGASRHRL
jgi:Glycosyl transferase family 2